MGPANISGKPGTTGAQSVVRALDLLRLLARTHPLGSDLAELTAATGLQRTTAYRLAQTLVHSGFAERDLHKRYRLGVQSMQLGLAAMNRAPLLDICLPALRAIARQTEDTVYLVVRNGDHSHALHVEEGSFPIKTFTALVGGLRVLGLSTAGQALLATLGDDEVQAIHRRHAKEYELHGLPLLKLQQALQRVRRKGYSETDGIIVPGAGGVGVAFEMTPGSHAAISVAAIKHRLSATRRAWIAEVISGQAAKLGLARD